MGTDIKDVFIQCLKALLLSYVINCFAAVGATLSR